MNDLTLRFIKGVGPKKEQLFNELGIRTVEDLLYCFPYRYQDRRNILPVFQVQDSQPVAVKGFISEIKLQRLPSGRSTRVKNIVRLTLGDQTGKCQCLWFNQPYLANILKIGQELMVFGKPEVTARRITFPSPEFELIKDQEPGISGKIVGIYRLGGSFSQKFMRKLIYSVLQEYKGRFTDALPFDIRKQHDFMNVAEGLQEIHFPSDWEKAELARARFIFEELFFSQVLVYLRKAEHRSQKGVKIAVRRETADKLRNNLPFALTLGQDQAVQHILTDLSKDWPMHRLIQGDVGCGKTVVAGFAMAACADSGSQAALMVPTEVLAYQHAQTLRDIFSCFDFNIAVLTSSLDKSVCRQVCQDLKSGKINVVVGTHALIQEQVEFKRLGLVVIDEQHKFGVAQRALLPQKAQVSPHCLVMSATPIPRSLALSLYGDLDLSMIKELPVSRVPAQTMWAKEDEREKIYQFVETKLKEGRQAYVIYPVIEESEDEDLKSLKEMHAVLGRRFFQFKAGMFHGRLKNDDKLKVIEKFRNKKIQILVSTTVVEVGIDIPNATVMVVENPERFGLAQLHQLRGRIQRSDLQPYFILLSKKELTENAARRLDVITRTSDGFVIAEEDLMLRGPGDFFGQFQHGFPILKLANPLKDLEVLSQARKDAYEVIKYDSDLARPEHRCIREHLGFWFQKPQDQTAGKP